MNNLEIIIHKWIINRYMKKKLVLPSLRFKFPAGGGLLPGRHLEMCVWRNFWIVTVTGDSPRHLDTKKKKKKHSMHTRQSGLMKNCHIIMSTALMGSLFLIGMIYGEILGNWNG